MNRDPFAVEQRSDDLLRAYDVFGIDPLDLADEFGFRFPKLSVSFLREKAERQLRDALGRFREMRAKLSRDGRGLDTTPTVPQPLERASMSGGWTERGRRSLGAFGNVGRANPRLDFNEGTPFEAPGDLDVPDLRYYVERRSLEQDAYRIDVEAWERMGRNGPRPEPSAWLQASEAYEADDFDGPTTAGGPEERLAYAEAYDEWKQAVRDRAGIRVEQEAWDYHNRGHEAWYYEPLDALGFSDRPTVLGKEEFADYEGLPLWRDPSLGEHGVGVFHRGKRGTGRPANEIMAQIQDAPPDLHYIGSGITGNGLYFGEYGIGMQYAGYELPWEKIDGLPDLPMEKNGAVMRIKLHPDTTTVQWEELVAMQNEDRKRSGQSPDDYEAIELFAAKNGYDVIIQNLGKRSATINVLNRSRMVVEDTGMRFDASKVPPRPTPGPEPEPPVRQRRRRGADRESQEWRSGPLV